MPQCLLIDRNPEERRKTAKLLSEMGFQVSEMADAREALEVGVSADAVLLTPRGQGLSASDFVRLYRRQARGKTPAILLAASAADTDEIEKAVLNGASDVLMQPFDSEVLAFKLRQAGKTW
jgi:two-component system, chemotaxis family, chemotaxis protein CheY